MKCDVVGIGAPINKKDLKELSNELVIPKQQEPEIISKY